MIKNLYKELYEWKFTDAPNECTIQFNFPETLNAECIEHKLNSTNEAIIVTIAQHVPIICGQLFAKAKDMKVNIENHTYTITITKEEAGPWPILIKMIHPDFQMIDPKSAFICFQQLSTVPDNPDTAKLGYQFLENSARAGYILAMQVLGGILLDTENRQKDGMVMLKQGADMYKDPLCCFQVGLLLATQYKDIQSGIEYLERAGNLGYGVAYFTLGQIYSPISPFQFDHKDPVKSMEYFNKVPEDAISPALLSEMAQFYEQGLGVEKDEAKAQELYAKAKEMTEKILADNQIQPQANEPTPQQIPMQPDEEKASTSQTLAFVGLAAAFVAGFGFMAFKRFTRK